MAAVEYFCYISRNKVDQLYAQIDPEALYEISELRQKETNVSADGQLSWNIFHVISLFKIGGTYGQKGVIQREAKVKQSYASKLQDVCLAIAQQGNIRPISSVPNGDDSVAGWFHHAGKFRIAEPIEYSATTDKIVTVVGDLGGRKLLLDCSLRNFSEGVLPDGTFNLSSSNARFFSGDLAMSMKSLFLVLGSDEKRVIGSPLFLKLVLDKSSVELGIERL